MCGWRQALLGSNLSSAKTIDALKKKGLDFLSGSFYFLFKGKQKLKKPSPGFHCRYAHRVSIQTLSISVCRLR